MFGPAGEIDAGVAIVFRLWRLPAVLLVETGAGGSWSPASS